MEGDVKEWKEWLPLGKEIQKLGVRGGEERRWGRKLSLLFRKMSTMCIERFIQTELNLKMLKKKKVNSLRSLTMSVHYKILNTYHVVSTQQVH